MERIVTDLLRITLDATPGDGTVELAAEQEGGPPPSRFQPLPGFRGPTANRLGLATTISRVRPHGGEITTPFTRGNASPFAIFQPTRSPPMKPSK